jgi:hypothetical protein
MYNDEWTEPPADEAAMWQKFEDILYAVDTDLSLPLETATDALADRMHIQNDGSVNRNALGVIRYRGISEENDQREYFLIMGRYLLPAVRQDVADRRLTPQFVQRWGQLLFCHGFIVSHIMDDGDHIAAQRTRNAGNKSRADRAAGKRTFIARLLLHYLNEGANRKGADDFAAAAILDYLNRTNGLITEDERAWWAEMLDRRTLSSRNPRLASSLTQKHLYDHELKAHAAAAIADLPSVEVLFPKT